MPQRMFVDTYFNTSHILEDTTHYSFLTMKNIILLMRPHQWLKNAFVFLPLFFDQKMLSGSEFVDAMLAFISFSFAASSIYCLNDIIDIEADRLHPKKCKRVLASGKISKTQALIVMAVLMVASIAIPLVAFQGRTMFELTAVTVLYIAMNMAYCLKIKKFAIVDVFTIATGFVMRVAAGGIATDIWISQWIVSLTFLLALFLAFAKRRDDVVIFNQSGTKTRNNIIRYNLEFLNSAISIVGTMTMICYIMWCMSEEVIERMGTDKLYMTALFVLLGIMRYLQVTMVDTKSGSPTTILYKDRFIHVCIAGWIATFYTIIYL